MQNDVGTEIIGNDKERSYTVVRTQEVGHIIEANKQEYNLATSDWKRSFNKVASIPTIFVEDFCKKRGVTFREFMGTPTLIREVVNDPALRYFRTKPGKI